MKERPTPHLRFIGDALQQWRTDPGWEWVFPDNPNTDSAGHGEWSDVPSEIGGKCKITNEQIKHMVDRFLGWRLPEHFRPDAGISFNPEYNVEFNAAHGNPPAHHQPYGTNLFDATQAEAMVRYT